MNQISASIVKELREKTGAGMMDCKKALTENNGNFDEAIDWLRKKGLSNAAKKSGRIAAQGLVALATDSNTGSLIELNSETDFVARNDKFQNLVKNIVELALETKSNDVEILKQSLIKESSRSVSDEISEHIAVIGENMNLRRVRTISVNEGVIASYIHNAVIENAGKIGVLISLESKADKKELNILGKQLAMHIAASKPDVLYSSEIRPEILEKEKEIFREKAKSSGKPESIIEKMIDGNIRKYYEEVVLSEQIFAIDGKTKISEVLDQTSKRLNAEIKIKEFAFFVLGDGIEQEQKNFADEVAAVIK